jgi:ATP-dependent DNA ligase
VIDGEIVTVVGDGKPSFSLLQNSDNADQTILFCAFDLLV